MEYLHAPWRIEYILAPKPPASARSLFTQIAESSDDVANLVIKRERSCYAVLNRYPYNGGHLLVVPYKQTDTLSDLTPEELRDLMLLVRRCIEALQRTMKPDGFNVGLNLGQVAGAGVLDHLHFHVVPRWNGDTNFMPVLGQTSVVPDALEEVAARLRAALAEENETTEKQPPEPPSPESAAAAASADVD